MQFKVGDTFRDNKGRVLNVVRQDQTDGMYVLKRANKEFRVSEETLKMYKQVNKKAAYLSE